jgi:hypothetical protein
VVACALIRLLAYNIEPSANNTSLVSVANPGVDMEAAVMAPVVPSSSMVDALVASNTSMMPSTPPPPAETVSTYSDFGITLLPKSTNKMTSFALNVGSVISISPTPVRMNMRGVGSRTLSAASPRISDVGLPSLSGLRVSTHGTIVRAIQASLYEMPASIKSSSALTLAELHTLLVEGTPSVIVAAASTERSAIVSSPLEIGDAKKSDINERIYTSDNVSHNSNAQLQLGGAEREEQSRQPRGDVHGGDVAPA